MENIEKILVDVGLSQTEASVYVIVLANGPITAGKISKLANKYRANIYQALEKLKSKGFISEIQGKRSKEFEALSPKHILTELKKKQSRFEKMLPLLSEMKGDSIITTKVRLIEGTNGWRHLLNEFLDVDKERVVYGIPNNAIELMGDFFNEYHKRRAKRKLKLRHLFNYDAKDRIKKTNKLPYTKSRYLPKELNQPVSTSVCGSIVALTVYKGKTITTLIIDNKVIADTYRTYFEFLWKKAKD